MKKFFIIFLSSLSLLTLFILLVRIGNLSIRETPEQNTSPRDTILSVSLWDLIDNPQLYHNRTIKVEGFLILKFEGCALYRDSVYTQQQYEGEEVYPVWVEVFKNDSLLFSINDITYDASISDFKSPTEYFDYIAKYLDEKEVEMIGVFNVNHRGHDDMYYGAIQNIVFIKVLTFYDRNPFEF